MVQGGERAVAGDFEDGSPSTCNIASGGRSAVKVAVLSLEQCRARPFAVCATSLGTETVNRGEASVWGHPEDGAGILKAASCGRSVEVAVRRLNQGGLRHCAMGRFEHKEVVQRLGRRGARQRDTKHDNGACKGKKTLRRRAAICHGRTS